MKDEIKLIRHNLGSISDLEPSKDLSESEFKGYSAQIFQAFPTLEKDIKEAMRGQIVLNNEAEDEKKLNFGRGVCNGFSLLKEYWERVAKEYESKLKEKEDFDKHESIGTI